MCPLGGDFKTYIEIWRLSYILLAIITTTAGPQAHLGSLAKWYAVRFGFCESFFFFFEFSEKHFNFCLWLLLDECWNLHIGWNSMGLSRKKSRNMWNHRTIVSEYIVNVTYDIVISITGCMMPVERVLHKWWSPQMWLQWIYLIYPKPDSKLE